MQVKGETNNMQGHTMHVKAHMQKNAMQMYRKVHMQGHEMQCIRTCICRGMQCNAAENAYAGACEVCVVIFLVIVLSSENLT